MLNKIFCLIFLWGLSLSLKAQQFSSPISYKTSIIQLNSLVVSEYDGYRYEGIPYEDHIMINDRQKFIYNLMYKAGSVNKPVYQEGNSTPTRLNEDQVLNLYCFYDSTMIEDPVTMILKDTVFRGCSDLLHDIKSLQFNETWSYSKTGSFFKKVNFLEPIVTVYDRNTGQEIGEKRLLRQQGGWSGFKAQPITQLIKYRVLIKDTARVPVELMKETERNTWVNMIKGLAINGQLKVYDPFIENVQLKTDEVKNILTTVDSIVQYRPYPPYAENDTVLVTSKWDQVSAIDFYESWSFDRNGNLIKEILAYRPLAAVYDPNTAEFRGFMPVFIIYNNEQARKKLEEMNFFWQRL